MASGDFEAASAVAKSAVPTSKTVWPGKNLSVAGFGVDSVWINIGHLRNDIVGYADARSPSQGLESF